MPFTDKWVLNYDGQEHLISEDEAKRLVDWKGEAEVREISKGEGHWVLVAVGPGIPFSITRSRIVEAEKPDRTITVF